LKTSEVLQFCSFAFNYQKCYNYIIAINNFLKMNHLELLNQAILSIDKSERPEPSLVVKTLLETEKQAKKERLLYKLENLLGTWRLCFVTGTKKAKKRAGVILGDGRYLPNFITIQLSYSSDQVENLVKFGCLEIKLTGPIKFLTPQNILAFDFTKIVVKLANFTIYGGEMRGGKAKEANFAQESIKKQAFFCYFLITDQIIAARGRGGGLALWEKVN
jgi:hypothetical protein